MNVIWLKSDYVAPPDTGGKLRTYNLLRELQKHCDVTYISLISDAMARRTSEVDWASRVVTFFREEEIKSGIAFYLRLLARMFSSRPYIVQKYTCSEILEKQQQIHASQTLDQPSEDQTVLICDFLEMAENVDWSTSWPKILFQHNVEGVICRRYVENETNWLKREYFRFESRRLTKYEKETCNRFDIVLTVSERDRQTLRDMGVTAPIDVIETGVDTEFFAPIEDVTPTPNRLLFLGSLDWMPNIDGLKWFVSEIYPRIKQLCPKVTLDIVGRRPIPLIANLPAEDSSIRVRADVPDVRPYIAACDLFIVPLRVGSGTRLKIFEAMAMGKPVVSTTIGAEGLPVQSGEHVELADSPHEFAEHVAWLLTNPEKKNAIADNGYHLVTKNYSWKDVSQRLFDVCQSTLARSREEVTVG